MHVGGTLQRNFRMPQTPNKLFPVPKIIVMDTSVYVPMLCFSSFKGTKYSLKLTKKSLLFGKKNKKNRNSSTKHVEWCVT